MEREAGSRKLLGEEYSVKEEESEKGMILSPLC